MDRLSVFGDGKKLSSVESITISGLIAVMLDLAWVIRDMIHNGFDWFYVIIALGFLYVIVTTIKVLIRYHNNRIRHLQEKIR